MKKAFFLARDSLIGLSRREKFAVLLAVDVCLVPLSLWLSIVLYGSPQDQLGTSNLSGWLVVVGTMCAAGMASSILLGLPRLKLNAFEQNGIMRSAAFAALVGLIGAVTHNFMVDGIFDGRALIIFTMVLMILAVGARIAMRNVLVALYQQGQARQKVLIYGAGQTGVQLAAALDTDDAFEPIAFVDDNPTLSRMTVAGLPVFSASRIEALIKQKGIDRVVLAMPSIGLARQARIARRLQKTGCVVSMLPSFAALVSEGRVLDQAQPIDPRSYLNREGLEDKLPGVSDIYAGKCVLITGAGGSIGSELARQVIYSCPARLVLLDASEAALYQIDHELSDLELRTIEVVPVLGSVTDEGTIRRTLEAHDVDIVLHAAAYKHVPLVEKNQLAGLRNNVIGTRIVADAARNANVSHFILVSTDKAVRPNSVMGASKRLAELLVQDFASRSDDTQFVMVRFGNVLGSSGSVVPLFEEQIARGGPITLTHADVTRFFMTVNEAARLVLVAGSCAGTAGDGMRGEMFVLDMGAPVPIQRLARQMIEAAGYSICDASNPNGDIEITITGLRPGEKLHEELTASGHALETTIHPKILRADEPRLSEIEVATALRDLTRAIDSDDTPAAREVLERWVGVSSVAKDVTGVSTEAPTGA